MHRPSGVKLWQHPAARAVPSFPFCAERDDPDDVHATSYLAASARMSSFAMRSIRTSVRRWFFIVHKHTYVVNNEFCPWGKTHPHACARRVLGKRAAHMGLFWQRSAKTAPCAPDFCQNSPMCAAPWKTLLTDPAFPWHLSWRYAQSFCTARSAAPIVTAHMRQFWQGAAKTASCAQAPAKTAPCAQ